MKYDLSVIITARNEEFLSRTVDGVLKNKRGNTEVIVVLDGAWANPPIEDHKDVTIIYHPESIGQRAAINEAAKLSTATYIMKLDAHCIVDEGFDVKLMADAQYDWTVIPRMFNLHAFDRVCPKCSHRIYQGPEPIKCEKCGTTMIREMVWKPRLNKRSDFMRFDNDLHFQYWGELGNRPESKGDIADTMSFVGACFFLNRKRYWELGGSEEEWGSWGNQGTEWSCKTWLSGGRLVVNKKTWFAHMFRTQGGSFGFPYPQSGKQVDHARQRSREFFLDNTWKGQKKPLSWMIEKFWPIPGWSEEDLLRVKKAGAIFTSIIHSIPSSVTDHTSSMTIDRSGENMPISTMSLSSLSSRSPISSQNIFSVRDELKMSGITAKSIVTKMIKDGNISPFSTRNISKKPCIHESMSSVPNFIDPDISISISSDTTSPNPTICDSVNSDFRENSISRFSRDFHNTIIPQNKGIIYYTDNLIPLKLGHMCRKEMLKTGLPIVSVSLKPMDFGKNFVMHMERGYLAYHKQILKALEESTADIIYFCEHDVLYHQSHFDFTPEKKDVYYYNFNWWRIRGSDGFAIHYDTHQVNLICAYRELLLNHYREKVRRIEKDGFTMRMGFEPGCNRRAERIDDFKAEVYNSAFPCLDIRHGANLTASRWNKEQFRNQESCTNWKETTLDKIDGWELPIDTFTKYSR